MLGSRLGYAPPYRGAAPPAWVPSRGSLWSPQPPHWGGWPRPHPWARLGRSSPGQRRPRWGWPRPLRRSSLRSQSAAAGLCGQPTLGFSVAAAGTAPRLKKRKRALLSPHRRRAFSKTRILYNRHGREFGGVFRPCLLPAFVIFFGCHLLGTSTAQKKITLGTKWGVLPNSPACIAPWWRWGFRGRSVCLLSCGDLRSAY